MSTTETSRASVFNQFSLKDGNDIVVRQSMRSAWGETKRDNELVSTMMMMQAQGRMGGTVGNKYVEWAAGEYPDEKAALAADFNSATDNTINLGSSYDRFFTGDRLFVTDGTEFAEVRLGAREGSGIYRVDSVLSDGNVTIESATANVDVLAPAVTYDAAARNYLNVKPGLLANRVQRMRDTVGAGEWETGESFLADHSLDGLMRKGFKSFSRKINKSIYCHNYTSTSAEGSSEDYGIMGGLPFFLNPAQFTQAETTVNGVKRLNAASSEYKGVNRVDTGTAISISNLDAWSVDLFERGSTKKAFFCSPAMYQKIREGMHANVNVFRSSLGELNPGLPMAWSAQTLELSFGELMIIPDRGATGIRQLVKDSTVTTRAADQLLWGTAVDLDDIGFAYYAPNGKGAQTPHIRDIDQMRNTSVKEVEFDASMTMVLGDPRLHGYYGITNS